MVAPSVPKRSEARSPAAHLTTLEPIKKSAIFLCCLLEKVFAPGKGFIDNFRSTENTLLLFSHWEDVYLGTFEFCSFPFHF